MGNEFIPQKYELCSRFSRKELAEILLSLSTEKDKHYIKFAKNKRIRKKYVDRLLSRAEELLHFIKKEARKRGGYDFFFDDNIAMKLKKNRFISFSVEE